LSDEVLCGLRFVAAFFFIGSFFVSIVSLLFPAKNNLKKPRLLRLAERRLMVQGLVVEIVYFDVSGWEMNSITIRYCVSCVALFVSAFR
jgi:hypothetical protein